MVHMESWLNKVDEIAAEGPSYKLGHDGALALLLRTVRSLSTRLPPPLLFPSLTKCYR